jgi:hypothetical protein
MKRLLSPILVLLLAAGVPISFGSDADPWTAWSYRANLHVRTPELADFSHMATVRLQLGSSAAKDLADLRILDEKGREQPWQLRSTSPSGEVTLVFQTVKGMRDYALIFGNPAATKPAYGLTWPIGRVLIDDRLPARSHTHGIWEWTPRPVVSGDFSHTSPLTDRVGFHGTSEMGELPIYEDTVIQQYVCLDKAKPPQQILMRFAFARRANEGDWEHKPYLILYWGKDRARGLSGTLLRMGDLPPAGEWVRLDIQLAEMLRRANLAGGQVYIYGIGFATDTGRAWWDLTSIGDIPGEADVVGLQRTPTVPMESGGRPTTFVWRRLHAFQLAEGPPKPEDNPDGIGRIPIGTRLLSEVAFFPSVPPRTKCRWDFGDGSTSEERQPVHLFENLDTAKVSLVVTEPAPDSIGTTVTAELTGLKLAAPEVRLAVELVSCPFLVRSDEKALFNLRLDADLDKSMDLDLHAILLDASGAEIGRQSKRLTVLPGIKHPTFTSFSVEVAAQKLSRVRFEARLHGMLLAKSVVAIESSRSALANLRLAGDRYVDASGTPVVVRCELSDASPPGPKPRAGPRLPGHVLLIGGLPTGEVPVEQYIEKAIAEVSRGPVTVKRIGVDVEPAWSMPFRQAIALSPDKIPAQTEVVIVGSATEMMLQGIPASSAADAIAVSVDQVRRSSDAEVFLLTPVVCSGNEDLARQYAVALRMLGIEKNVPVIDVYSRSIRLGTDKPELLKTSKVVGGVRVQEINPAMLREITSGVVDSLVAPPDVLQTSK